MQKLSDVRFPAENDIPALKELWHIAFGDDFDYINKFFSTAFQKENALWHHSVSSQDHCKTYIYLLKYV